MKAAGIPQIDFCTGSRSMLFSSGNCGEYGSGVNCIWLEEWELVKMSKADSDFRHVVQHQDVVQVVPAVS